jgi:hypothetical protein
MFLAIGNAFCWLKLVLLESVQHFRGMVFFDVLGYNMSNCDAVFDNVVAQVVGA